MTNEEIGVNVQATCYACLLSDTRCDDCQDQRDANDTDRAWELVDEGNLQYKYTLSHIQTNPSGHDWTERDGEFASPSHKLVDGMDEELAMHLSLGELDDETQRKREVECPWCHLLTPKQFNDCQDCERPLESNVR